MSLVGRWEVNNASATNFEVTYHLRNNGDTTKHICKYFTPLERVMSKRHIQIIECTTGQPLPYKGIMAERVAPSVSNGAYVSLAPGDSVHFKQTIDFFDVQPGQRYELVAPISVSCIESLSKNAVSRANSVETEECFVTIN